MPCSSCGGGRATPSAMTGVTGQPAGQRPVTKWRVTYPNGAVVEFKHEWQAVQAQAISGGSLERLDPAPNSTVQHPQ